MPGTQPGGRITAVIASGASSTCLTCGQRAICSSAVTGTAARTERFVTDLIRAPRSAQPGHRHVAADLDIRGRRGRDARRQLRRPEPHRQPRVELALGRRQRRFDLLQRGDLRPLISLRRSRQRARQHEADGPRHPLVHFTLPGSRGPPTGLMCGTLLRGRGAVTLRWSAWGRETGRGNRRGDRVANLDLFDGVTVADRFSDT